MRLPGTFALALALAACDSGGGSPAPAASGGGVTTADVHLLFDAAASAPHIVEAEVAGAVLELAGGGTTANLLPAPRTVTFCDPSGGVRALSLPAAPAGDYTQLRLLLTPGSGRIVRSGAAAEPLDCPPEVEVPIAGRLLHGAADAWTTVGSLGADDVFDVGGRAVWQPQLAARLDEAPVTLAGLVPLRAEGVDLLASLPDVADGQLRLVFAIDCAFSEGPGRAVASRGEFLAAADANDQIEAHGALLRDGSLYVKSARLLPRRYEPALHGAVVASDPAQRRAQFRVDAEDLRGRLRPLATPYVVDVDLAGAWLHEARHDEPLAGWPCVPGARFLVHVAARTAVGGFVTLASDEAVLVPDQGVPPLVEWHGRVTAVDAALGTITVAPAPFVPLYVAGVPVPTATIVLDPESTVWRRELLGQGLYAVALASVQPGVDRVWWRGQPIGPSAVRGEFVRVRTGP